MKFNKKRISISLACMIAFGNISVPYAIENIDNHWAKHSLQAFLEKGYIKGDQNGNIHPNKKITRAEFVSIVNNALSYTKPSDKISSYSDVKKNDWYYKAFSIALAEGYISGTGTDKLSPQSSLTRQEAIKIIDNVVSKNCDFDLSVVKDEKRIPSWAKQATKNMIAQGYISGYEGNINPGVSMTKAEAIAFLNAYVNNDRTISFEGTYSLGEVNTLRVLSNGVTIKDSSIKKLIIDKNLDGKLNLQNVTVEMMQNESKKISIIQEEQQQYADGVYEGTANGYSGEIKVQVTIEKGKISKIDILSQKEELIYFNSAKKVIDRILEKQTLQVDVSTGATISSKGIMYAVQDALSKAEKKIETKVSEYKDGTYIGEANGFSDTVKVEVVIAGGKITDTKLLSHSDDDSYMNSAVNLLQDVKSKQTADNIDGISGATYSSDGILNAVRDALSQAKGLTKATGQSEYAFKNLGGGNAGGSGHAGAKKEKDFSFLENGTYEGYASGYRPNSMGVRVTVAGRKISKIDVIKNNDDKEYLTDEGIKTLEKRIIEKQSTRVDVISKATASSKGYINAVVNALEKAYSKDSTMADRYEQDIEELIIGQSEKLSEYRLRAALKSLAPTTTITMLNKIDTKVLGNYPLNIKLDFSDKSTKKIKITIKVQEKANNHLFLSFDELEEIDKKTVYTDGVYYGDAFGHHHVKPIPLKVTISNKKISSVEKVPEEMTIVGEKDTIDDGVGYEERLFNLISHIKASDTPQKIIYTITRVDEVTDEVMNNTDVTLEQAKKKPEDVVQKIKDALDAVIGKHEFGTSKKTLTVANLESSSLSSMSDIKTIVRGLIKDYVKEELGYSIDEFDIISSATFSGTGGTTAIKNALYKMNTHIVDMRIDHNSYKKQINLGDALDISNLTVTLYDKERNPTVVKYPEFDKYGIEVYNFEKPSIIIKNGDTIDNSKLKYISSSTSLILGIRHKQSKSVKRSQSITVSTPTIALQDVKLQVRKKGGSEWYDALGLKGNKDDFHKNIYTNREVYDKLINEELEFKRITQDANGNKKEFILDATISHDEKGKYYTIEVPLDSLTNENSANYTMRYPNLRLYLYPYSGEINADKTFADNYKPISKISLLKSQNITKEYISSLFTDLFKKTDINITKYPNVATEGKTDMQIVLTFDDTSKKTVDIDVEVVSKNQATEYKKQFDAEKVKFSFKTEPEKYKGNTVLQNAKSNGKTLEENKELLKKIDKDSISNIEIVKMPDLEKVGESQNTTVKLTFNDNSILPDLSVPTSIEPYYANDIDTASIDISTMKKTYAKGSAIYDLEQLKITPKIITKGGTGEEGVLLGMAVPYEDFKYFGISVVHHDETKDTRVTKDTKIEESWIQENAIKVSLLISHGKKYIPIEGLHSSEAVSKADLFKQNNDILVDKLYTIAVPSRKELSEHPDISSIHENTKLTDTYLKYYLGLSGKQGKLSALDIKEDKVIVTVKNTVDYQSLEPQKVNIELKFTEDNSTVVYENIPLEVRPIPIYHFKVYRETEYKLVDTINFGKDMKIHVKVYKADSQVADNHIVHLIKYGKLLIEPLEYDDLKYFGLKIYDKDNHEVRNDIPVNEISGTAMKDAGLVLRYYLEQGTTDENGEYHTNENPSLSGSSNKEESLRIKIIE